MKRDENGLIEANDGTKHWSHYHAAKHEDEAYKIASARMTKGADLNGKLAQIVTMLVFFFIGIFCLENKAYFLLSLNIIVGGATVWAVDWCVKRIPEGIRFLIMVAIIFTVLFVCAMVKR